MSSSLTLLSLEPETKLEFHGGSGAAEGEGSSVSKLVLSNTSSYPVAFKVKSTAPKSYAIKPSSGSIKSKQTAEVQIVRRPPEENATAAKESRKPDRFLVQAAIVDTEEKKLLLHAASRGKSVGLAKFWENVPKDNLEEQQLEAVLHEGSNGAGPDAASEPNSVGVERGRGDKAAKGSGKDKGGKEGKDNSAGVAHRAAAGGAQGLPSSDDVDSIVNKMSKPGRSQPVTSRAVGTSAPPGFGGEASICTTSEEAPSGGGGSCLKGLLKKPVQRRNEDLVLQKHSRPVTFVLVDPNGTALYTCGKDKLVMSWTIPDGEFIKCYGGHRGAVWACSLTPDASLLLTCGADNLVLLWEVSSAQRLAEVQLPGVARCVEWAPSGPHSVGNCGRLRFVACNNSFSKKPATLAIYDFGAVSSGQIEEAQKLITVEEPSLPSAAVQVAWAGVACEHICSAHACGQVFFWNSNSGSSIGRLEAHAGTLSQVAFPSNRSLMATCGRADMEVRLWDLRSGVAEGQITLLQSFKGDRPLNSVALRPSLTCMDLATVSAGGIRTALCDCLVGGGQDARDVALVGAGTDDQFEPVMLRLGIGQDMEECMDDESEEQKGKKSGGHFGPIHTLSLCCHGAPLCISGSEDGNVRIREVCPSAAVPPATAPSTEAAPSTAAPSAAVPEPRQQPQQQPLPKEPQQPQQPQQPTLPPAPLSDALLRVVAMYDFDPMAHGWPAGTEHKPLPLRKGQEIQVVQDVGGGWAMGRIVGNPEKQGFFPMNYVMSLAKYHEIMQPYLAAAALEQAAKEKAQQGLGLQGFGFTGGLASSGYGQTATSELGLGLGLGLAQSAQGGDIKEDDDEDGDCSQS